MCESFRIEVYWLLQKKKVYWLQRKKDEVMWPHMTYGPMHVAGTICWFTCAVGKSGIERYQYIDWWFSICDTQINFYTTTKK